VDLNESMCDLAPPADYKVQSVDWNMSTPGEQDLVDAFKACAKLSGGEFPNSVGLLGQLSFVVK
jgi:hypothetical protein